MLGERFALGALLGSGSSARVFLATDLRLQCPVAVKILHESLAADARFVAQLRREARLAAALGHDHIVTILDSGEAEIEGLAIPYIVSEHMAGGSLEGILGGGVHLEREQVVKLGREAADALAFAHGEGLVHRDVKPSNLLFDTDGRLALADFGIARALAEASATEPVDAGAGATRYASPEAVMGAPADPAGDVYSLALVLLECLTGEVPLLGDTPVATMGRRVSEPVEVPRGLGRLGVALSAATTRDPERRARAAELVGMLDSASDELGPATALPLRPPALSDDRTAELVVDRSDGSVRIVGVAPIGSVAGSAGPHDEPDDSDLIDLTDDTADEPGDGESSEGSDRPDSAHGADISEFGRDAITVAQEYHALDASRPGSHGAVEPLPSPEHPTAPRKSPRRRRVARTLVLVGVLVVLAAVLGAGWWFLVRVPTHVVPDWVGADISEVTATAQRNGWELAPVRHDRRDGTRVGEVLAQEPGAGTDLAEGETIGVTVSDGFTLTDIPELVGLDEADALTAVEASGLVAGARSTAHDETVPAGALISAGPSADAGVPGEPGRVPRGTSIDYMVSDGPAPRVVPDGIVGVPLDDARAALEAVQLGVSSSEQYSSTVEQGVVISSDSEPGTELPRDSVVALVVSAGPEPIVVPDLTGRTGTEAAAALEEAGFRVSGIEGSPSGAVLATDPPAGESRLPGAAVRVFTRSG